MTVVLVRSYSRISGRSSLETDRFTSGSARLKASAMRRSWSGFAYAWSSETATERMPSEATVATTASTSSSSRGMRTSPSKLTLSLTSSRSRRSTSGRGFW